MCGIAGFYSEKMSKEQGRKVLSEMTASIRHRGPDGEGFWQLPEGRVFLGHRRLSILDLSPDGAQPMQSVCGRYVLSFNGEIYNFQDLKNEIQKQDPYFPFRGHSDTEVLLGCFSLWGVEEAVKKTVGMFTIACWDSNENRLLLIRDRAGEKPLYWGQVNGELFFASEIRACLQFPSFVPIIESSSVGLLHKYGYIPAPYSIFKNLHKIEPGTIVSFKDGVTTIYKYWDLFSKYIDAQENIYDGTFEDASKDLEIKLSQAVKRQMQSDVPLGAFLSGGIDSSLIVSIMQSQSAQKVKTFTIGFAESGYDEAVFAKSVAKHIGTDHTEVYLASQDALDVIPRLAEIYDEPFGDSSQIPTYLVSAIAKKNVTVALSGDAGDELFGGYQRYISIQKMWNRLKVVPASMRRAVGDLMTSVPPKTWSQFSSLEMLLPSELRGPRLGERIHKVGGVLGKASAKALYDSLVTQSESVVVKNWSPSKGFEFDQIGLLDKMMLSDLHAYLPGDILTKVDRAAMSVSLETRVPFLDHEVMELAFRIPHQMKVENGRGKLILRKILEKYVPQNLIDRPKMGFGVPLDQWLRGPLKEWAAQLLNSDSIGEFFDKEDIQKKWREHLTGKKNWHHELWNVLMFEEWKRTVFAKRN